MLQQIYYLTIFIYFISSLNPYPFWGIPEIIFSGVAAITSFVYCQVYKRDFSLTNRNIRTILLLFVFLIYTSLNMSIYGFLHNMFVGITISVIIISNIQIKKAIIEYISKFFAVLLAISLSLFLLHFLFNISLPSYYVEFRDQYAYNNFTFFLHLPSYHDLILPRFNSIFLEPGHLGMIISYLLAANSFNMRRWYNVILLVVAIFTFSLATYVLLLAGFLLIRINNIRTSCITLLTLFIIIYPTYRLSEGTDNIVDRLIIQRLEIVDGDIAGNNRVTEDFDNDFKKLANNSRELMFGKTYDREKYDGGNAGAKLYIYVNGVIGLLLVVLAYWGFTIGYPITTTYPLIMLYALSFLQRAYPVWSSWLIPFACGVAVLHTQFKVKEQ